MQFNPSNMALSQAQDERMQELKQKIKDADNNWKAGLSSDEQKEYLALKDLTKDKPDEPMLPQSYVIDMLNDIWAFVPDGDQRSKILQLKIKVQKF